MSRPFPFNFWDTLTPEEWAEIEEKFPMTNQPAQAEQQWIRTYREGHDYAWVLETSEGQTVALCHSPVTANRIIAAIKAEADLATAREALAEADRLTSESLSSPPRDRLRAIHVVTGAALKKLNHQP